MVCYNERIATAGQGHYRVREEAEEEERAGLPVGRAGIPRRGREDEDQARPLAGLPRRAREGLRRPRRPLQGRGRGRERGREGGGRADNGDAAPAPEDRQARRGPHRHGRGRAERLLPPRTRDPRFLRAAQDVAGVLLRPVQDTRAADVEPRLGARVEGGRVRVEGPLPAQVRLLARRRVPLPRLPRRQRRRAGQAHEQLDRGGSRAARQDQALLRRHQLLLRDGRRGRRRPEEEGRLQGAPPGGHRADGAAARRGGGCPWTTSCSRAT